MSIRDKDQIEEDHVLWQRVTEKVTPLKSSRRAHGFRQDDLLPPVKSKAPARKNKARPAPAPIKTMVKQPTGLVDLRQGEHAGLDRSTRRKLFRGDVPVSRRIDLHGLTAAQAERQLQHFIADSAHAGHRCVLVITGKGARGDGVLRRYVPDWLKAPSMASVVLAIATARPADGGDGALYVLLRRKRGAP